MTATAREELPALPRTKIVATVGPSCCTPEGLLTLARAGVSVFRLNFSHGTHDDHGRSIDAIRAVEAEFRRPLAMMADLCGPKIRIDSFIGEVPIREGDRVRFSSTRHDPEGKLFRVSLEGLESSAAPGRMILVDDGLLRFRVERVTDGDAECVALNPGVLRPRKGVNLPGAPLSISAMTEKDHEDLAFALARGVDFVALSFVRRATDLQEARAAMQRAGRTVPLIAKVEMAEAVEHLGEVVAAADGVMVARGDLGVEIPMERLPAVQQRIINECNRVGKPVITATQMLNSMIANPSPTRAEVTDIFNAIQQGTDAVMLSGETAAGAYPVAAVEMMARVAREAEAAKGAPTNPTLPSDTTEDQAVAESVCAAAIGLSRDLRLDAIVCATMRGTTARRLARHRPLCPVLAFSTEPSTVHRLCLTWGVEPRLVRQIWQTEMDSGGDSAAIIWTSLDAARREGLLCEGQRVVIVAGLPLGTTGRTNFLHVLEINPEGGIF